MNHPTLSAAVVTLGHAFRVVDAARKWADLELARQDVQIVPSKFAAMKACREMAGVMWNALLAVEKEVTAPDRPLRVVLTAMLADLGGADRIDGTHIRLMLDAALRALDSIEAEGPPGTAAAPVALHGVGSMLMAATGPAPVLPPSVAEKVAALTRAVAASRDASAVDIDEEDSEAWVALERAADALVEALQQIQDGSPRAVANDPAPLTLRPEVAAFAQLMERELRANDHKPGWSDDDVSDLMARLREETAELDAAIDHRYTNSVQDGPRVAKEAADVANFAMMIADVCGGLGAVANEQTKGDSCRNQPSDAASAAVVEGSSSRTPTTEDHAGASATSAREPGGRAGTYASGDGSPPSKTDPTLPNDPVSACREALGAWRTGNGLAGYIGLTSFGDALATAAEALIAECGRLRASWETYNALRLQAEAGERSAEAEVARMRDDLANAKARDGYYGAMISVCLRGNVFDAYKAPEQFAPMLAERLLEAAETDVSEARLQAEVARLTAEVRRLREHGELYDDTRKFLNGIRAEFFGREPSNSHGIDQCLVLEHDLKKWQAEVARLTGELQTARGLLVRCERYHQGAHSALGREIRAFLKPSAEKGGTAK